MEASAPSCLFAYGTLMVAEIWTAVTATRAVAEPATLSGYRRYRVAGADFPAIIASDNPQDRVGGCIYPDLDEEVFHLLDRYEDRFYERCQVSVESPDGTLIACQAYVVLEKHRNLLSNDDWDLDWFRQHAQSRYLGGMNPPGR